MKTVNEIKEQIQEDIITYLESINIINQDIIDEICNIVVDNFRKIKN